MEAAICTLVSQFQSFAGKDGSSSTLSREEFQHLVSSQLPNFVKVGLSSVNHSRAASWTSLVFRKTEGAASVRNRFISRLAYADNR